MSAYLLAWNPRRWPWTELPEVVAAFEDGEAPIQRWSCGRIKHIELGARVFLIRLVEQPKGVFGFGTVVRSSYEDVHWEDATRTSQYVKSQVDWIVHPEEEMIVLRDRLDSGVLSEGHWDTQSSGVRIHGEVAIALQAECEQVASEGGFALPDEIHATTTYPEGAKRVVTINSYERNPRARQACIAHYGAQCSICGFSFAGAYGDVGDGLNHVHHLLPLSQQGEAYKLKPIEDLRPVCPNCHAILHRRVPPFTIEAVKAMLRTPPG